MHQVIAVVLAASITVSSAQANEKPKFCKADGGVIIMLTAVGVYAMIQTIRAWRWKAEAEKLKAAKNC